jgi:hypothetical protein
MEVDSPEFDSPEGQEAWSAHTLGSEHWSAAARFLPSSQHTAGWRSTSLSEEAWIAMIRQLVDGLLQQYKVLAMERDATAKTLCELRQDLIEQQVSRMEVEADLEDVISRLRASNSALEVKLANREESQKAKPLKVLRELSSFSRKRKRTSCCENVSERSRKRRRCS